MVKNAQGVIDNIPGEGALAYTAEYSKREFSFTQEQADTIIDKFFEGKVPPPSDAVKKAEVLLGATGSGKSYEAGLRYEEMDEEQREGTIFVSYDENGAIFAIDEYVKDLQDNVPDFEDEHIPVDGETLDVRTELWDDYRQFSQYVRTGILKRALSENYNLVVDTTSSSMGTTYLIKALRDLDYKQIKVTGTFSPFPIAVKRLRDRVRPTSNEEIVNKRIGDPSKNLGALNMIEPLMQAADIFEYRYNPNNNEPSKVAFSFNTIEDTEDVDVAVIQQIAQDLENDADLMFEFIQDKGLKEIGNYNPKDPDNWIDQSLKGLDGLFIQAQEGPKFNDPGL